MALKVRSCTLGPWDPKKPIPPERGFRYGSVMEKRSSSSKAPRRPPGRGKAAKRRAGAWWPLVLVVGLLIIFGPKLVGPPCPNRVVIAAGASHGAYFRYAQRYREALAEDGIELSVLPTSGAKENLQRLTDPDQAVSLAMFQGGAATTMAGVESLAAVYLEPVWVFVRGDRAPQYLTELAGRRIAIGANGSGTQALSTQLLRANGLTPEASGTRWLAMNGVDAAQALATGRIDAAVFVTAVDSPLVRQLLAEPNIHLMDFQRGPAYETKFRFLTSVTLPQGAVDLANNLPREPKRLLAPPASVIARDDLHPAVVPLMMKAMIDVHGEGETLSKPGEFPSMHHVTFPMRKMSRHYLKYGPSVLYRLLPFWLAAWIDRTKLLMLPIVTVLLPALRIAPPVYVWRVRRRIYRWYGLIREVDEQLRSQTLGNPLQAQNQLEKVESAIRNVAVPMGYMEEFFNLRATLDDVRIRLEKHCANATGKLGGKSPGDAPDLPRVRAARRAA